MFSNILVYNIMFLLQLQRIILNYMYFWFLLWLDCSLFTFMIVAVGFMQDK